MTDQTTARSTGSGPPSALAQVVARLDQPGSRRRFVTVGPAGPAPDPDHRWVPVTELFGPSSVAARQAADPVASLGMGELTASMAFHGLAVPVVDLAASVLVTSGVGVELDGSRLWAHCSGHAVAELALADDLTVSGRPAEAHEAVPPAVVDRVADQLVALLDPVVSAVAPSAPEQRWGAVADLVAIIGLGRQRALAAGTGPSADEAWARIDALVGALRERRPSPHERPVPLTLAVGGRSLVVARRATCCEWYRAARLLGEPSVSDARCADCPSLDVATKVARLTALAETGDLAAP